MKANAEANYSDGKCSEQLLVHLIVAAIIVVEFHPGRTDYRSLAPLTLRCITALKKMEIRCRNLTC
jgi:hypothetical protein